MNISPALQRRSTFRARSLGCGVFRFKILITSENTKLRCEHGTLCCRSIEQLPVQVRSALYPTLVESMPDATGSGLTTLERSARSASAALTLALNSASVSSTSSSQEPIVLRSSGTSDSSSSLGGIPLFAVQTMYIFAMSINLPVDHASRFVAFHVSRILPHEIFLQTIVHPSPCLSRRLLHQ